ncbi:jg27486 [Pararge aegeria aegeria]|uniref:Jg27486 protein n=1 Tax=Pararge aegeria aegeria TaxID=348720 RepID=A0A8S4QGH0_9NEOP|nr:jg27486 [Pararge aegeria aegeria]
MRCNLPAVFIPWRGGHAQKLGAGDAGVDAGSRAVGPADRPVPGGGAVRGHVRARPRLLLQRQAAQPSHVGRRRQQGHHTRTYQPRHVPTARGRLAALRQFHAMDTLHKSGYSIEAALSSLVPASGPVLCRDEMEEWSASEANLFEESLDKYGKDFADIRKDFVSLIK